jgi:hypothetical protein
VQVTLSPDEAAQYHPETGAVVEPGDTVDIEDAELAKGLLEQVDKWLPAAKKTAKPKGEN